MRRAALLAPAVCLTIALAACSSSTKGTGSHLAGPTTSKPSTAAASTSAAAPSSATNGAAPDEAKLKTFVLTAADVPAGWTGTPAQSSTADDAAQHAQLAGCLGIPNSDPQKVAEADSPNFDLNDSEISSNAASYKSQAVIDSDIGGITGAKAQSCFDQQFRAAATSNLPAGATVDKFTFHITPGANGGPSSIIATGTGQATITAQGQTVTLFIDVAFIKGNLVEAEVDFLGFGQRIDPAVQSKAINAVATRVAAG